MVDRVAVNNLLADSLWVFLLDLFLHETEFVEIRLEQRGCGLLGGLRAAGGLQERAEVLVVQLVLFDALGLLEFCADQILHFVFCFLERELRGLDQLYFDQLIEVAVCELRHEHDLDVALVGFALRRVGEAVFDLVDLEFGV